MLETNVDLLVAKKKKKGGGIAPALASLTVWFVDYTLLLVPLSLAK